MDTQQRHHVPSSPPGPNSSIRARMSSRGGDGAGVAAPLRTMSRGEEVKRGELFGESVEVQQLTIPTTIVTLPDDGPLPKGDKGSTQVPLKQPVPQPPTVGRKVPNASTSLSSSSASAMSSSFAGSVTLPKIPLSKLSPNGTSGASTARVASTRVSIADSYPSAATARSRSSVAGPNSASRRSSNNSSKSVSSQPQGKTKKKRSVAASLPPIRSKQPKRYGSPLGLRNYLEEEAEAEKEARRRQVLLLPNGGVVDISDIPREEATRIFGAEKLHNIDAGIAKKVVSRKREGSEMLQASWNDKLGRTLEEHDFDESDFAGPGFGSASEAASPTTIKSLHRRYSTVKGGDASASMLSLPTNALQRQSSVLKAVAKIQRKSQAQKFLSTGDLSGSVTDAASPLVHAFESGAFGMKVNEESPLGSPAESPLAPSNPTKNVGSPGKGKGMLSTTWSPRGGARSPSANSNASSTARSVRSSPKTLHLLPRLEQCPSAASYVDERISLLRQSKELREDFETVVMDNIHEKRLKNEARVMALEERRGVSHLEPIDIKQASEKRDWQLAEAQRNRLQIASATQQQRMELVETVKAKQHRAGLMREYMHCLPVLIKRWQMNLFLHKTTTVIRQTVKAGYLRRWKSLCILYMFRWWVVQTRKRHARIAELRFNMVIRRRLPQILRKFRTRRREKAQPMVLNFLVHYCSAVKISRIISKFQRHVKRAQRFIRRRRIAKTLLTQAITMQWDDEFDMLLNTSQASSPLPKEYRDLVIHALITLDMDRYVDTRNEVIDDYITALEKAERMQVEKNLELLREQQAAMHTMVAGAATLREPGRASPTPGDAAGGQSPRSKLSDKTDRQAALAALEPVFSQPNFHGADAADNRRKLVVMVMKDRRDRELKAQHQRLFATSFKKFKRPVFGKQSQQQEQRDERSVSVSVNEPKVANLANAALAATAARRRSSVAAAFSGQSSASFFAGGDGQGEDEVPADGKVLQNEDDDVFFTSETHRRQIDPFDPKKLPEEGNGHPLAWLFGMVKPLVLPRRKMLTSRKAVNLLIKAAREEFFKTWKQYVVEVNEANGLRGPEATATHVKSTEFGIAAPVTLEHAEEMTAAQQTEIILNRVNVAFIHRVLDAIR